MSRSELHSKTYFRSHELGTEYKERESERKRKKALRMCKVVPFFWLRGFVGFEGFVLLSSHATITEKLLKNSSLWELKESPLYARASRDVFQLSNLFLNLLLHIWNAAAFGL